MRNITTGTIGLLFILGPAFTGLPAQAPGLTLQPGSRLWVQGTSNVKDFTCTAGSLAVQLETAGDSGVARRVAAGEKAITAVDVKVAAQSLDCADKKMNEHMLKAIKAEANPVIEFRVSSYTLSTDSTAEHATLNGTLTLGGAQQPVVIDALVQVDSAGALHVTGAYSLRMKDYGLKPPTLMFGAFKVHDPVTVDFDLRLAQ